MNGQIQMPNKALETTIFFFRYAILCVLFANTYFD